LRSQDEHLHYTLDAGFPPLACSLFPSLLLILRVIGVCHRLYIVVFTGLRVIEIELPDLEAEACTAHSRSDQ
jgi:hypothetical protein